MARIRTTKPEFWISEQVTECSRNSRLLFIGMWNFCDDNGIHKANCKRLKAEVFPLDEDINSGDIRKWMDELIANGLVIEFKEDESQVDSYWWVTGWSSHQKINKPSPSRYPLFTDECMTIQGGLQERSPPERKGTEGNGVDRSGREGQSPAGDGYSQPFLEFWKAYPKKAGKRPALEAWKKSVARVPEEQANLVTTDHDGSSSQKLWRQIEYVRQQAEAYGKSAIAQTHPANPATWLNQDRWADDPEAWEVDYSGKPKEHPASVTSGYQYDPNAKGIGK